MLATCIRRCGRFRSASATFFAIAPSMHPSTPGSPPSQPKSSPRLTILLASSASQIWSLERANACLAATSSTRSASSPGSRSTPLAPYVATTSCCNLSTGHQQQHLHPTLSLLLMLQIRTQTLLQPPRTLPSEAQHHLTRPLLSHIPAQHQEMPQTFRGNQAFTEALVQVLLLQARTLDICQPRRLTRSLRILSRRP